MTPAMAEKLLYNDIIPLSVVIEEHARFKKVLQAEAEVLEFSELLTESLQDSDIYRVLAEAVIINSEIEDRRDELLGMGAEAFVSAYIRGLKRRNTSLCKYLDSRNHDIDPLPNLYFTRDMAMVYGDMVITGAMANRVRRPEALAAAAVFSGNSSLAGSGILFEGHRNIDPAVMIEGGDFLVIAENCLLIGISERTSADAVDIIAAAIGRTRKAVVFAVILPRERATIHLDMVLTQLSENEMMVYKPCFSGSSKLRVVRIELEPGREPEISDEHDLFDALRREGHDMELVYCGDADPVQQQREQWLSGNNFFALAPGKVIGYHCNNYTMEALYRAGYEIKTDEEFLSAGRPASDYGKLAIGIRGAELARGGGGPRCMTLPVRRQEI